MSVIDIRDAAAMREMGLPLNTPVIEGHFSPQVEKQIDKAAKAFGAFRKRIDAFCENKNRSGFYAMRRAHDKLVYLIRQAQADAEWKETADGGSEMVNPEHVAAALWIGKLAISTDGWQELFDKADNAAERGETEFKITTEMFAVLWPFNGKHLFRPGETP